MEGSKGAAIFESLNLNPQLFVNEVLNVVDDLLNESFDYFLREASTQLQTEGTDRFDELTKGVSYIQNLVQFALDERMEKWESYCLRFCFHVPEELSLPKATALPGNDIPDLDALTDIELDAQLTSLRDKLALVGKESAELGRELYALERQSQSTSHFAGCIDEALEAYKKQDTTQMFQELSTMASEFRARLVNLKKRRTEEIQHGKSSRLRVTQSDVLGNNTGNGLFNATIETLKEFLDEI